MTPLNHNKGFTLIEIMIVLAIMAGIMSLSVNYLVSSNRSQKKFLHQFALVSKEIQSKAKLYNATFRIVIRLGAEDSDEEQSFWVERSRVAGVLLEGESPIKDILEAKEDNEDSPPSDFSLAKKVFKEPQIIPKGLRISSVEMATAKAEITEGYAYIYFLPQGLVDESAIHFKSTQLEVQKHWTIAFHPLTGKANTLPKYIALKDIYSQ